MKLAGASFDYEPSEMSELLTLKKDCARVVTYSSRAFFSWGESLQDFITLTWDYMTAVQYADLVAIAKMADVQTVVFDPEDGSGKTYDVWLGTPKGKYCNTAMVIHRRDVEMKLYIQGEHA